MKTESTDMQERAQQLWRELDGLDWSSHELAIVGILREALEDVSQQFIPQTIADSGYHQGRFHGLKEARSFAIKMRFAASKTLEKEHDDDAAAQFDTANEIAEAIEDRMKLLDVPISDEAYGTTECPICGNSGLHNHPELEQKGYIVALKISNELNRRGQMPLHELSKLCGYHLAEYEQQRR